jgi:peptidoglycan/xylan/chitin deacetylase (PgdA/CDA1 family)
MQIQSIPIISYHKIEPHGDLGITARHPEQFSRDLAILLTFGYKTITFKDIQNNHSLPDKPVVITFDDGYRSVYDYAFPKMSAIGFKGVVFIPSGYVGRNNDWDVQLRRKKYAHMDWSQLKELQDQGFEIGSHTQSHCDLTGMNDLRLHQEIIGSREQLNEALKTEIISLCYPFGRFNPKVIEAVRNAGYRYGVASVHFRNIADVSIDYYLRKFNIYRLDTEDMFIRKLKFDFDSSLAHRDWLIQLGGRATVVYQHLFRKGRLQA